MQEKPKYKGRGGLTQKMRCQLTSAARCAIKMRSKERDIQKAVKHLERDLKNGPYHCFGLHENCSPDFCLSAKERVASFVQDSTDRPVDDDNLDHIDSGDHLACKSVIKKENNCIHYVT